MGKATGKKIPKNTQTDAGGHQGQGCFSNPNPFLAWHEETSCGKWSLFGMIGETMELVMAQLL